MAHGGFFADYAVWVVADGRDGVDHEGDIVDGFGGEEVGGMMGVEVGQLGDDVGFVKMFFD